MHLKTFRPIFFILIAFSLFFFLYGCNPAKVGTSSKAADPSELSVAGNDSRGIPLLKSVGSPVVIMFTGNY